MSTYEAWLDAVRMLPAGSSLAKQHVVWADGGSSLGLSLSADGEVEILIPGHELDIAHPAVKGRATHDVWFSQQFGQRLEATKLTLPKGPEFTPAAAWICAELDRHDVAAHPANAFRRIEALIALIIDGLAGRAEDFVGLLGEIVVLRNLIEEAPPERRVDILGGWRGYKPSLRDLSLSHIGIEVKATRGPGPYHHFQGIHQVERSPDESTLLVVSVGVDLDAENGGCLDDELDRIEAAIAEPLSLQETTRQMTELRGLIDRYGVSTSTNLSMDGLQRRMLRQKPFSVVWVRAYDATSQDLGLPGRRALAGLSEHLDPDSVSFSLRLPTTAAPYLVAGPRAMARQALEGIGWLELAQD